MNDLDPLLRATLILVAHPDDEVVACGSLMQKMRKAVVVFATDGAPRNDVFWKQYGSRQGYSAVRREEANTALESIGADAIFLADYIEGGIADQELFLNLPAAISQITTMVSQVRPDCILTPAYEGGHPDHDAACFIGSVLGRRTEVPVWESPLYHRKADGSVAVQTFAELTGREHEVPVDGASPASVREKEKKLAMIHAYKSQGLVLEAFRPELETFRPLANYDFTRPPLPWKLNYEHWEWAMTGADVAAAFTAFLEAERLEG
jgi:LmbE family N-acetylglucosaminyl deacetylase